MSDTEHTKAYYLAKQYYPTYWSKERLQALVDQGLMTQDEYDEIVGG